MDSAEGTEAIKGFHDRGEILHWVLGLVTIFDW